MKNKNGITRIWLIIIIAMILIILSTLLIFNRKNNITNTSNSEINENIFIINISINPEIELYIDINTNQVVNINCKNEDAEKIIESINFNFINTSYEEATEKFITACVDKGYLNESNNDINITVIQCDESKEIFAEYSEKIQNVCNEINNITEFNIVTQIKTGEYHNDSADITEFTDNDNNSNSNDEVSVVCPGCNGTGKCEECNGEGKFVCSVCGGTAGSPCSECGGDGLIPCPSCNGYGGCKACNKTGTITCDKCSGKGCDWCNGTGKMECKTCHGNAICEWCEDKAGSGYHHCNACAGTGKTSCYRCNLLGYEICQGCNGDGLCPNCHGQK